MFVGGIPHYSKLHDNVFVNLLFKNIQINVKLNYNLTKTFKCIKKYCIKYNFPQKQNTASNRLYAEYVVRYSQYFINTTN